MSAFRFLGRAASPAMVAFLVAVLVACGDPPSPASCGPIPAGGCIAPLGTCVDPTCSGLYACSAATGRWSLREACARGGGHGGDGDAGMPDGGVTSAPDAGAPPTMYDSVPGARGGPGCRPLETPDCSLSAGAACARGGSCCDCQDLFVCTSGSWELWGACQSGTLTPM